MLKSLLTLAICLLITADLRAGDPLEVRFDKNGLQSLSYQQLELLKAGQPRVGRVHWDSGEPEIVPGSFTPECTFDEKSRRLEQTWSMGNLVCIYHPESDRLGLSLSFTNTSDRPLSNIQISALALAFPETPHGPGWYETLHTTSEGIDDVPAVLADYGHGTLLAASETVQPEIALSLWSAHDKEHRIYDLAIRTVDRSARDYRHLDKFSLAPGESVRFSVSLRFGPEKSSFTNLAGDVLAKYAERFPPVLKWDDRRPIAMLMLASSSPQHHSSLNPRGWLSEPKLDMVTTDRKLRFRKRLLAWVAQSVAICKSMSAQGAIVWDVEGEEFQPLVYVGDPRMLPKLAPEFDEIADEVLQKFTDAGLKTGICIRPSRIVANWESDPDLPWRHGHMSFDPVEEMADKIAYAKKRWGCTLFYIDTNVTWAYVGEKKDESGEPTSWVMRAEMMRRLAQKHPDVLLIPEFQYTGYYSHVSGYRELRGGQASTPERVRAAYPDAFSVINVADGKIRERRADLLAAVQRGDILMFRGWYNAPENASVKAIYFDARKPGLGPEPKNLRNTRSC